MILHCPVCFTDMCDRVEEGKNNIYECMSVSCGNKYMLTWLEDDHRSDMYKLVFTRWQGRGDK